MLCPGAPAVRPAIPTHDALPQRPAILSQTLEIDPALWTRWSLLREYLKSKRKFKTMITSH